MISPTPRNRYPEWKYGKLIIDKVAALTPHTYLNLSHCEICGHDFSGISHNKLGALKLVQTKFRSHFRNVHPGRLSEVIIETGPVDG